MSARYDIRGFLRSLVATGSVAGVFLSPAAAVPRIDHEAQCTYKELTWDDFRGSVLRGQGTAWISSTIMLDSYEIEVLEEEDGSFTARVKYPGVYALMDKTRSSAQPGGRSDDNLAHEQLHFDLTEYYARLFAIEIQEISANGPERSWELRSALEIQVQEAYRKTLDAHFEHEARYDEETKHSLRKRAQKKWQRDVSALLAKTPAYVLR